MSKISEAVLKEEAARLRSAFNTLKYRKGLTQSAVAHACGWKSASTFNRLLYAKVELTEASLELLCKALDVEPVTISPRLAQRAEPDAVLLRRIPVQSISVGDDLRWTSKAPTSYVVVHHSIDPGALALSIDGPAVPEELRSWILLLEKDAKPEVGDWVLFELPGNGETLGKVFNIEPTGGVGVVRPDGVKTLLSATKLSTLTSLLRKGSQQLEGSKANASSQSADTDTPIQKRNHGFSGGNPAPGRSSKSAHARI